MLDHYVYGVVDRVCPEAPVPILDYKSKSDFLGGAGVAVDNLINLSFEPTFLTVLGEDEETKKVLELLEKKRVNTDAIIIDPKRQTTKKTRFVSTSPSWKFLLRCDKETKAPISKEIEDKLLEKFKKYINEVDYILVSDYNKGVLTPQVIKNILIIANKERKKVIVDTKGKIQEYKGAYLIAPNKKELFAAFNENSSEDLNRVKEYAKKLSKQTNSIMVIKLSDKGAYFFDGKNEGHFPSVARKVINVSGAGDIFVVGLIAALASGYSLSDAVKIANYGAGKSVEREKPELKKSDFAEKDRILRG